MRSARATGGTVVFLVVAPGLVAGFVPWLLTGWDAHDTWVGFRVLGLVLVVAGTGCLLEAFARFVLEGLGTPAPVAPTEHLVVGGLYRYVRNPMYLAVGATIVGQALLLARPIVLAYAALFGVAVLGLRPLVRGARARATVRRRLRGVSAGRPGLVAEAPSLGGREARQCESGRLARTTVVGGKRSARSAGTRTRST